MKSSMAYMAYNKRASSNLQHSTAGVLTGFTMQKTMKVYTTYRTISDERISQPSNLVTSQAGIPQKLLTSFDKWLSNNAKVLFNKAEL